MASARAALRLRASLPGSPAEIVADVNRQFTEDVGDTGAFMTLFYLAVDGTRRAARWVRAGHDPAIYYEPESERFEELGGGARSAWTGHVFGQPSQDGGSSLGRTASGKPAGRTASGEALQLIRLTAIGARHHSGGHQALKPRQGASQRMISPWWGQDIKRF
jgi:sigma-B regulation protein RsbU (phosphoserine phosphatase)